MKAVSLCSVVVASLFVTVTMFTFTAGASQSRQPNLSCLSRLDRQAVAEVFRKLEMHEQASRHAGNWRLVRLSEIKTIKERSLSKKVYIWEVVGGNTYETEHFVGIGQYSMLAGQTYYADISHLWITVKYQDGDLKFTKR